MNLSITNILLFIVPTVIKLLISDNSLLVYEMHDIDLYPQLLYSFILIVLVDL